jgi:hypothetical protein
MDFKEPFSEIRSFHIGIIQSSAGLIFLDTHRNYTVGIVT